MVRGWPPRRADPFVKICGITRPDLAEAAVAAGADMVGLVHFPPSPRHLDLAAAADVARAADGAMMVALTVDADDATLDAFMSAIRPDMLQCHGRESPERMGILAARYGCPLIKAIGVASAADLKRIGEYEALALLDAKPPKGADRPGGHGAVFDWTLLEGLSSRTDYMLSGGLDADNVASAVAATAPYGVDVSSGVETDGVKDVAKIKAFVARAKGTSLGLQ